MSFYLEEEIDVSLSFDYEKVAEDVIILPPNRVKVEIEAAKEVVKDKELHKEVTEDIIEDKELYKEVTEELDKEIGDAFDKEDL